MDAGAGNVEVYNIDLITPNTRYVLPLESNYYIRSITIQARTNAPILIHFDDSSEYITLKPGGVYWEQGIRYAKTIDFESTVAETVVEVVVFGEQT